MTHFLLPTTAKMCIRDRTPTVAGLYQVNFIVPPNLGPGNQPIVLNVNGVSTPPGAFVAIGQ